MTSIAERVVLRVLRAKEFETEKALRQYLKEHPDADPARHTVNKNTRKPGQQPDQPKPKKPGLPKPPPPAGHKAVPPQAPKPPAGKATPPKLPPEAKKEKPQEPAKTPTKAQPPPVPPEAKKPPEKAPEAKPVGRFDAWKTRFKGLSESAQSFVEKAPKAVKHFFGNDEFRKNTLDEASSALKKAPKKMVNNLVETAKHEVHEFKTASAGVKNVMSGKKMSKKQKAAFKEVATHLSIAAAAAAFTATGPLVGAGLFAKGLATHVALKSVKKSLANLHLLEELGHIGHGVVHLLSHIASEDKEKGSDPSAADEAMAKLVLATVVKEIEGLTDEDFQEVLNSMGDGEDKEASQRVAARFLADRSVA